MRIRKTCLCSVRKECVVRNEKYLWMDTLEQSHRWYWESGHTCVTSGWVTITAAN